MKVATHPKFEEVYREGPLHLAKVIFGMPRRSCSGTDASDAIEQYLAALLKNGQIGDEYLGGYGTPGCGLRLSSRNGCT